MYARTRLSFGTAVISQQDFVRVHMFYPLSDWTAYHLNALKCVTECRKKCVNAAEAKVTENDTAICVQYVPQPFPLSRMSFDQSTLNNSLLSRQMMN